MTVLLYLSIIYSAILLSFIIGLLLSVRKGITPQSLQYKHISVIVACKNEEAVITGVINSLQNQTYPKEFYEVIFADDGSTDTTSEIIKTQIAGIENFHYIYVDTTNPDLIGKKRAITTAINSSKGEILAFTDADCLPDTDWLTDINNAMAQNTDFYAGYSPLFQPTTARQGRTLYSLKNLERSSIFAVSAAGFGLHTPLSCTARNMAYTRNLWEKSQGFNGIGHIRSGDDDLMLHKMRKHIKKYHFSFNPKATVPSIENKDFSKQIDSETRRLSKFIHYPIYVQLLCIAVAGYYIILLYTIIATILAPPLNNSTLHTPHFTLLASLIAKLLLEFLLLFIFLKKVRKLKLLYYFPFAELLYIPYFLIFGIKGTFSRYKWKN